ncbi:TPA: hypothetical protein ACJEU7_002379 [Acinetobacter baumannii]|uniref:hypothetical protein n=1 Tax=Acinetobacter baumannii TaxID=470 RepID=UPI002252DFF2|nr:hypothetical protein [Acinetobacter baumannii]MCX3034165.1 hypothetical protein [Acinetobacter baumannii]
MCKSFSLKAACVDCPFKKGKGYLTPERIEGIMDVMKSEDGIFPCHKTVSGERQEYEEVLSQIMDIASEIEDLHERQLEIEKLKIEYNLADYEAKYIKSLEDEKVCAGWLILSEKEGILFNNFRMRLAAMQGLLDMGTYKNKELVYDTIDEAMKAHD